MGLPLLRGRDFTAQDGKADPDQISVAVVNDAFVRRYVNGRDPIGARFGWGNPPNVKYAFEIVGVVRDAVYEDLREQITPLIYLPFAVGRHLRRARRGFARRRDGDPSARDPGR